MKHNIKMIAAAVALVVSGAANAAFTSGAAGGADDSLVFVAWNGTTSYIENLSQTNAAGLAGNWIATASTPTSASFQLNSLFASTFTSGTGLNWAVFGGSGTLGAQIINTTGLSNVSVAAPLAIANANSSIDTWFIALNSTTVGTNGFGTITLTDPNSPAMVAPGYNNNVQGNTYMTGYGYINFESLADLGSQNGDLLTDGKGFTLASNGALTYGTQAAPSSVPLPAAAWLFGSGLLGLIGVGRRKQS